MKKDFGWLSFLKICEPTTIFKVFTGIIIFFSAVFAVQAWVVDINKTISEGKCAIAKGETRAEEVNNLKTQMCVVNEKLESIEKKIDNNKIDTDRQLESQNKMLVVLVQRTR